MSDIRILPMGPRVYAVEVHEGQGVSRHVKVTVPAQLIDDLGIVDLDEAALVRESIGFLLERVPATSVRDEFALDEIADEYAEWAAEIQARLGT